MVSASRDHKLVAGTYVLTITATTKKDKGTSKNTTLTIVISETVTPIASIKYESGNKLEGKQKVALNSKNAIIEPKNVPISFTIAKISKDKKDFENPKSGGFKINGKGGKISLPKNHVLKAGTYVLEVLGINKKDKKDKRKIQVTVVIK
ncbi:hypothetical protein [Flagellimonas pacifica]|nr:hypothetical protein [Allomuricauda parva]